MEKILHTIIVLVLFFSAQVQAQDYYYTNGKKIYVYPKANCYVICFNKEIIQREKKDFLIKNGLKADIETLASEYVIIEATDLGDKEIKYLANSRLIKRITNLYNVPGTNEEFTINDKIIVKFRSNISQFQIDALISEHNLQLIKKKWLGERVFLFRINRIDEKLVLELANQLYESGLVEFSHPDFITFDWTETNDTYYESQWNLTKISVANAWTISTGNSSIIIAILDCGVESDHPDLEYDLVTGYDVVGDDNSTNPYNDWFHGTGCAGIAAARTNNSTGIAGVGYNCKIMPIQFTYNNNWASSSNFSSGINWARSNGAHVISISGNTTTADAVNNAINSATSNGRGGLGCVVVKSAGNSGGTISFPGQHSKVIAVGATNSSDNRYSYSSYGAALDVMAPSSVYTTDLAGSAGNNSTDYIGSFTGTSAAAPHVAGLAGLILSEDNTISEKQVRDIICYSADDKGTTGWDQYYGWGRINAYDALRITTSGTLPGKEVWRGTITINDNVTIPASGKLLILPGTTIKFNSGKKLTVNGALKAEGTASNPITFTRSGSSGTWGGIRVNSSAAGASIDHVVVEYASTGILNNGCSRVDVYNSKIRNCSVGISLYNVNPISGYKIFQNEIYSNSTAGVEYDNSLVWLMKNNIHHNGDGVYCYDNSDYHAATNDIHDNSYGVYAESECAPNFVNNNIMSSTNYNMVSCDYSDVDADTNYWGSNTRSVIENKLAIEGGSSIVYDPWEDSLLAKPATAITENSDKKTTPDLEKARELLKAKDYAKAQELCKEIIASDSDSRIQHYALNVYFTAGRRLAAETNGITGNEMISYFKELDDKKENKELSGYAALLYSKYSTDKLKTLDNIIDDYGEYDRIVRSALYDKLKYYHIEMENAEMARAVLAVLEKDFPGSNVTFNAKRLLGDDTPRDPGKLFAVNNESLSKEAVVSIPEKYCLYDAYPNPFNPGTTIKYDLPFNSRVNLAIYNVRGQRIKSFTYSSVPAGAHTLKWEGTNSSGSHLASGLYIIRFTAESLEGKPELFQKSMKVILLK